MQSEKKGDKEMKLYKVYVMTYYEIEAENLEETFAKMTDENISDSWVEKYEEEEIEKIKRVIDNAIHF